MKLSYEYCRAILQIRECILPVHGYIHVIFLCDNYLIWSLAIIQQIPGVSPTNKYTTIAPLALVLLASAFKEVEEDLVLVSCTNSPRPILTHLCRNDINRTPN
jgi:hypothetical protein